jgi:hypothetical protein
MGAVSMLFHGFPARLVADWCGVSLSTAKGYKSGRRRVPRPVLRLWSLYRQRRYLGEEWSGWLINGESIVDPDGNSTTLGQLRAYWIVMQLTAEYARLLGPDHQRRYYDALELPALACETPPLALTRPVGAGGPWTARSKKVQGRAERSARLTGGLRSKLRQ